MRCEGKIVLVTGAQRGIGRAVALRFAREGAHVALNFFDDKPAAEPRRPRSRRSAAGAARLGLTSRSPRRRGASWPRPSVTWDRSISW